MALDKIIEESLHSHQYGTLTNNELRTIMLIVENAKRDLNKHDGNGRNYDLEYKVTVDGKSLDKLEGEN